MALRLTQADIRDALPVMELIDTMEAALASFSSGAVVQPVRTVLELGDGALFGTMPAYIKEPPVHGAKLLTVIPSNASRGLPTHLATIVLLDPATGELLALVEGRFVTEVRTAAVSAVSVRHLASPDASVLAILGSGSQARSHLAILPLVRPFRHIRAWSPTPAHLRRLVSESPTPVEPATTAEEAVRGADVVVLATSSVTPVIADDWVMPGAHVISLGACRPTQREIDPDLIARAALIVDSKAAALRESGDIVQGIREGRFSEDHIRAELGEVVSQRPGRVSPQEITVFKSLGLAVEDLAAAHLVYRRALEQGKGSEIAN